MRLTLLLPTLFEVAVLLTAVPVRLFRSLVLFGKKTRADLIYAALWLVRTCRCLRNSSQEPQT
jgi:hypothetical protein